MKQVSVFRGEKKKMIVMGENFVETGGGFLFIHFFFLLFVCSSFLVLLLPALLKLFYYYISCCVCLSVTLNLKKISVFTGISPKFHDDGSLNASSPVFKTNLQMTQILFPESKCLKSIRVHLALGTMF